MLHYPSIHTTFVVDDRPPGGPGNLQQDSKFDLIKEVRTQGYHSLLKQDSRTACKKIPALTKKHSRIAHQPTKPSPYPSWETPELSNEKFRSFKSHSHSWGSLSPTSSIDHARVQNWQGECSEFAMLIQMLHHPPTPATTVVGDKPFGRPGGLQ